jgi:DNA-binding CsgD family transcriptional regulator
MPGGEIAGNDEVLGYLELALAESRSDPRLHAIVRVEFAINQLVTQVARVREAESWLLEMLPISRRAGVDAYRDVLYGLAWARALGGRRIDRVCRRFRAASETDGYMVASIERIAGQQLVWRGEVEQARPVLTRLLSLAEERGEPISHVLQRLHVCELEVRVGAWQAAERLLDEWAEPSERDILLWPMYERCRALLAAGRGLPQEADHWASEAIARAEATGVRWDRLEAVRARGVAALLAGDSQRAADELGAVWEYTSREGIDEPGVFPVAPELVEALVELGQVERAHAVNGRLAELAEAQSHPWGHASAKRGAGLIALAETGWDDAAAGALEQAADACGALGLRFDRARTLFALGRAQRRLKKWGAARRSLERAVAAFEEIGSHGWAEAARSETARVGARRPAAPGELTPAEARVAELAADGLSNKEIAGTLFITVHTVERHLKHVYAKLGIHSRNQLSRRLTTSA